MLTLMAFPTLDISHKIPTATNWWNSSCKASKARPKSHIRNQNKVDLIPRNSTTVIGFTGFAVLKIRMNYYKRWDIEATLQYV